MKSNKLKIGAIVSIVFNALGIFGYAALWFVLVLAVGLAKGFGGEGADVKNLDIVMNFSLVLVAICVAVLVIAILVLAKSNKNFKNCKKLVIALVCMLFVKTVLNIISIIIVLDILSIAIALVVVADIVSVILLLLGIKNQKIVMPENLENTRLLQPTENE